MNSFRTGLAGQTKPFGLTSMRFEQGNIETLGAAVSEAAALITKNIVGVRAGAH